MSVNTSVKDFAAELKVPVDTLLDQLNLAGVPKESGLDIISEDDKEKLLQTLRNAHSQTGSAGKRKKITLTKRTTSEIKQADPSGKSRTIQVEVRKKRVFVKKKTYNDKSTDLPNDGEGENVKKDDLSKNAGAVDYEAEMQDGSTDKEKSSTVEHKPPPPL